MHSSNIINLSPSDDLNKYLKKPGPVILDFSATWCGPCQKMSPILHSAAEKYKFTLIIIDVDKNQKLSQQYGISGIPHVYLYIDGQLKMEFTGFDSNQLNEMIKLAASKVNKFAGKGVSVGGSESKRKEYNNDITDIPSEPPDSDSVFHIKFKYNNDEFERRFLGNNTIREVRAYVRKKIGAKNVCIFSPFPRKVYDNDQATIEGSGISKREMLSVSLQ
jgi:thiol-disulfide isomerase/thioredoxin